MQFFARSERFATNRSLPGEKFQVTSRSAQGTGSAAHVNQGLAPSGGKGLPVVRELVRRPVAKPGERGVALVLFVFLMMSVVIPLVGLAVDGSVLYWLQVRLSSAVDSAALATCRSLSVGLTLAAQNTAATQTGQQYFAANFSNGFLGTSVTGGVPTINIVQASAHVRTATVQANIVAPTYFMQIVGYRTVKLYAQGQASRRDANVVLVLDRSGSMNLNGSCSSLVASAQNFVNDFVDGRDQLGLITFQTGANIDYAPSLTFKSGSPSLSSVLGTLQCAGDTSSAQGLHLAYQEITSVINQPGALNVILFFTDGQPNGVAANFPVKTQADTRYDWANTSTLASYAPSGCVSSSPITGLIGDGSSEHATLNAYGYTSAILSIAGVPLTSTANPTLVTAPGCSFSNSNWNYSILGRADVAYIPTTDTYGNSTVDSNYKPLDYFPAGGPYAGMIRPDMPRTVRYASFNAADSQAMTIRSDTTYSPIIYTIGLQGNEPMAMDQDFMERLSNDPRASNYDKTRPSGTFILATNTGQLSAAFQQIASQILRLSQ